MTEVAKLYGGSLYDLAAEEGLTETILAQLEQTAALLEENPQWLHLLSQPNIPKKERCALLDEALAKNGAEPYLVSFLKLLCERGSLGETKGCAREYRRRYNADHGIVEATAISAAPLSAPQAEALRKKLEARTGKTVQLTVKLDPRVLGGIRLDMDGVRLDGTVQHRLQTLGGSIENVVL